MPYISPPILRTYNSSKRPDSAQSSARLGVHYSREQQRNHNRRVVLVEVGVCSLRAVEQVHGLLLLSRSGIGHVGAVRECLRVYDLRWLAESSYAESVPHSKLFYIRLVCGFGRLEEGGTNEAGECGDADDVAGCAR